MNLNWLFRMSQWARNPPSIKRVKLVFAVVAGLLVIYGLEHFGLWPDAFSSQRMRP